jgi:hypothetical protein
LLGGPSSSRARRPLAPPTHTASPPHPTPPPPQAAEALRRAKFKFPGRQKIVTSRNWGFTPYARDDYVQWKKEGRLVNSGVHATLVGCRGALAERDPSLIFATPARIHHIPNHAE